MAIELFYSIKRISIIFYHCLIIKIFDFNMIKLAFLGLSLLGVSHSLRASHTDEPMTFMDCDKMDPTQDGLVNSDEDVACVFRALNS